MTKEEAKKLANQKNALFTIPDFSRDVYIKYHDGSTFHIAHAFIIIVEEWLLVFAEHFEPFIFAVDEVDVYQYRDLSRP